MHNFMFGDFTIHLQLFPVRQRDQSPEAIPGKLDKSIWKLYKMV